MYTLRKISTNGTQVNIDLGKCYTIIHRDMNYDEFCKYFKLIFGYNHVADTDKLSNEVTKDVYAFLDTSEREISMYEDIFPLYKSQHNYIMTDSGKTFDNLSYK